jgi:integrase
MGAFIMLLTEILTSIKSEVDIVHGTFEQYARAERRLSEQLGRAAVVTDLTTDTINHFLIWLKSEHRVTNTTTRNYRSAIIRIWNFASDRYGHDACIPRRLRSPKKEPVIVRAWTLPELHILMQAAEDMPGQLRCGVPASLFMLAWIWVGYETGYRPGDIREIKWGSVDLEKRTITIVQHKTGRIHTSLFSERSAELLRKLQAFGEQNVFPLDKTGVTRWEGILFRRAEKLGFKKFAGQGIGTLRKSHATQIYQQSGIAASAESLGHVSGVAVARNHYVDARQRTGHIPRAPGDEGSHQRRA